MKKYVSKLLILASLTVLPLQAMEQAIKEEEIKEKTNEEKVSEALKGDKDLISFDAVKKLITHGLSFNFNYEVIDRSGKKRTFLHLIMGINDNCKDKIKILEYFINNGADAAKTNSDRETLLHLSANNLALQLDLVHLKKLKLLKKLKFKILVNDELQAWIDKKDNNNNTALISSIILQSKFSLQMLLEYWDDPATVDRYGKTMFHLSANNPGVLFHLTSVAKFKGEIDKKDDDFNTALFYSLFHDNKQCTEILLESGADSDKNEKLGEIVKNKDKIVKNEDENKKIKEWYEELKKDVKKERFFPICLKKDDNCSIQFLSCENHFDIEKTIKEFVTKQNENIENIDNVYLLDNIIWCTEERVWTNYKEKKKSLYEIALHTKEQFKKSRERKNIGYFPKDNSESKKKNFDLYCKAVDDLLKKKESNTDKNPDSSWFKDNKGMIAIIGVIFTIIILAYLASLTIPKIKKEKKYPKKKKEREVV